MSLYLKRNIRLIFSSINLFLLLFQSFVPGIFAFLPTKAFAQEDQSVENVVLEFSSESNEFDLSVDAQSDVEYVLSYEDQDGVAGGITGLAKVTDGVAYATQYAGSCSTGAECLSDTVATGLLELPNAEYKSEFIVTDAGLWLVSDSVATTYSVELGVEYVAPQNENVKVQFTKLPETPGNLRIEEIVLTDEQVTQLGAYSNVAYDITSDMPNGSFEYKLELPLPEGIDENVQIVYAETVEELDLAEVVESSEIISKTMVAEGLDHFTVFVVVPKDSGSIAIAENQAGWLFNRDLSTSNPFEFNTDQASIGTGSLYVFPIGATPANKFIAENFLMTPISEVNSISYDFMIGSGGVEADKVHFYMNVYANFGVSNDDKFYDCRYNIVPTVGSVAGFSTVTFDPTQAYPVTTRTGDFASPYPCPAVPADMDLLSTGSNIRVISLNVGDTSPTASDAGLDGYLDNVIVITNSETTTYDFEPVELTKPTNLGWNLRSKSATPGERPVDVVCGKSTNGDYPTHGNGMLAHNWSTDGSVAGLKYQRQWQWPGSGSWTTDSTVYTDTNTAFATFGSAAGTEGTWNTRVRSWLDLNSNNVMDPRIDLVSDWSDECSVTYDRTAPAKPSLVSPANGATVTGNPQQKWDAVDDAHHYIYASYSDAGLTSEIYSTTVNGTSRTVGGYQTISFWWHVKAVDSAGNESPWSDARLMHIDNSSPSTPIINGFINPNLACGSVSNIHNTTVDWTDSTDLGSGLHHYEYNIDYPKPDGTRGTWTTTLTPSQYSGSLNEGLHSVRVRAVDVAGNKSSWSNICDITTDWTAPVVDITSHSENDLISGVVTFTGEITEEHLGNYNLALYEDGDNVWDFSKRIWQANVTNPPAPIGDVTTISHSFDTTTLDDGYYLLRLAARDKAGNRDPMGNSGTGVSIEVIRILIDNNNPSSIITKPTATDGDQITNGGQAETNEFDGLIEGTATDGTGSGINHVLLSISLLEFGDDESERQYWDATASAWVATDSTFQADGAETWDYQIPEEEVLEGTYTITSHAVDNAGNVESTYTIVVVYDKTIPGVTLTIDPTNPNGNNGWYKTQPTITLEDTDNYQTDYIEYKWNSGSWTTYTAPISPPGEGQNILYYRGVDAVGNYATDSSDIGVKEVKFDKTEPANGPLNVRVENIGSTTATGKWSKNDGDETAHEYRISWKHKETGTEYSATVSSNTFEHQLTNLFDGLWEFKVQLLDAAGNNKAATAEFRVGSQPGGEVLGTTTDPTSGALTVNTGLFTGSQAKLDQDTEDLENEEDTADDSSNTAADGLEPGSVLGESDTSCVTWKYYLPLFLLLIQMLFAVSLEIANRDPSMKKLLMALVISGLMIGAFYMLRDPSCYGDSAGMMKTLSQWFIPISLLFAGLLRGVGSSLFEEK